MDKNMPVGGTFVYGDVELEVIRMCDVVICKNCYFNNVECDYLEIPYCLEDYRTDGLNVIFREIKDVF